MPNEIGVMVKDGVVTLSGWVDSYTKTWAAEEAAPCPRRESRGERD
jgi:osmotically-inducible protein OsmY